jgi:soluble lytic murein transglycosylase-like protein
MALLASPAWCGPAEVDSSLLAFLPPGQPSMAALDRLFEAGRGRVMTADAMRTLPQALARAEKKAESEPVLKASEIRTTRILSARHQAAVDRFDPIILEQSERYKLNPSLLKAIIAAESEFRADAKSRAGALGLMQMMPNTARSLGVHPQTLFDPQTSIAAGAKYLARLFYIVFRRHHLTGLYSRAPDWAVHRVLAAYNAGLKFLRERPLYKETKKYIKRVFLYKAAGVAKITSSSGA